MARTQESVSRYESRHHNEVSVKSEGAGTQGLRHIVSDRRSAGERLSGGSCRVSTIGCVCSQEGTGKEEKMIVDAQLTRANLHEVFMRAYDTGHARYKIGSIWEEVEQIRKAQQALLPPQGGANPVTGLRNRWDQIVNAATGQSREIDFNIAIGMAIEIFQVNCVIGTAANTATQQSMEVLVDFDGPALAGNSINSAALFLARSQLESVIANFEHSTDLLTSGGAPTSVLQNYTYPIPWLTARNLGIADFAVVSTGVALTGIMHRFVDLNNMERLELFALGRS